MNLREASRTPWGCTGDKGAATIQDIQTGCLQRIAESLESINCSVARLSVATQSLDRERVRSAGSRRRTRKDFRDLRDRVEKLEGKK